MFRVPGSPLRRSLDELRDQGRRIAIGELAETLLALDSPIDGELARRLVAVALGQPASALPAELGPEQLRPAEELALRAVPIELADFVVVDLETTGLGPEASILEIGAVRIEKLQLADRFESLVRPPGAIPERISELTGISEPLLADAPASLQVLPAFRSWLAATPRAVFVAHNAEFDTGFLRRGFAEHGLPPLESPVLCTRKLARRALPALGNYSLDALCTAFGISNRARHRALGDALATARALLWLLPLAREREAVQQLGELFDLQRRKLPRRRRKRSSRVKRPAAAPG